MRPEDKREPSRRQAKPKAAPRRRIVRDASKFARSRITTGTALLAGIDGRSHWARIMRDTLNAIVAHCGGYDEISETRRMMARRAGANLPRKQVREHPRRRRRAFPGRRRGLWPPCRQPAADRRGVRLGAHAEGHRAEPRPNLERGAPAVSATCQSCGTSFTPKREWQRFCSPACKDKTKKRRRRRPEKRGDRASPLSPPVKCGDKPPAPPRRPLRANVAPTVNPPPVRYGWVPSQSDPPLTPGDDYPIEMDADGVTPILPECLRRMPT